MFYAGDEVSHRHPMESNSLTGLGEVGEKQLMMAGRSGEVALGKGGRRHRRAAIRGQEKSHLEEMQEKDVAVKKELPCKVEEEVEFGREGSKDKVMNLAKEGDREILRQDSYEDNSLFESKCKQQDSGKEGGVMVKSYQPLLLHRAPRYSHSQLQILNESNS